MAAMPHHCIDPRDGLSVRRIKRRIAGDRLKAGAQDRNRISLHEDYEVQNWMASFGVSKEKLAEALHAVGDRAEDVREHLSR